MMNTVLIVEDRQGMLDMLTTALQAEGFAVRGSSTLDAGFKELSSGGIDIVVTDLKLPDGDGMQMLRAVKDSSPFMPVVVMTAYGSIERAVHAVKEGAYDFITKPFDSDHLVLIIKRALGERDMQRENLLMREEFSEFLTMPEMVGVSPAWRNVLEKVYKVAPLRTTVLILGESGTGKELIARAIHHLSPRAKKAFVAVNCAAIPKDLIESELFGHEKGAFTGAHEVKIGKFEISDKGSILLDEIADMELSLQSKILRIIQENEVERIGATSAIKVDLRIIAASNKNLAGEVSGKRFREDLYYRLSVFPIVIPPLRERREDIIPLTHNFLALFSREIRKPVPALSAEIESMLINYEWKGNVRELRNVIERAMILCDGPVLRPEHFGLDRSLTMRDISDGSLHAVTEAAKSIAEKAQIEEILSKTKGNKTQAAEILQISYKTLLTKIKEYGIS